jgi:PAS domain S-box-containing protein
MSEKPTYEELEKQFLDQEKSRPEITKIEKLLRPEIFWRRILIEESRDGIVILDQNGKVKESNKKFAHMLGYSMEEIRKLHVWDWDAQFDKEILQQMILTINESGDSLETRQRRKDGTFIDVEISSNGAVFEGEKFIFCICRDITDKKRAAKEREDLIEKLQEALSEIKMLRGILPLCTFCKRIRDDKGYWEQVDIYIHKYSEADISHSVCPECMRKHYPDEYNEICSD